MLQLSQTYREVNKAWEEGLRVDTKNSEFTGHKDIWQNPQDNKETNEDNSATVLNQLWLGKR